jgi:NAD/NADP octopine/nopaline dehydrogenase, alpha-helical domain/NADP oxidoreductase coenzyme F420-dependent
VSSRLLAICGGGNAGHALAVVTSQSFDGDVAWLVGSEEKAELLRCALHGGLTSTGVIAARADRLRIVSADPADVIPDADVVLVAVPAFAHRPVLAQIGPYLKESVLLGCTPTRGGFEFEVTELVSGIAPAGGRTIFGLQTLPWSTRVVTPGSVVNFGARKAKVLMATLPSWSASALADSLSQLFGVEVGATDGFLNLTLGNAGQHIHPGLMHGHFAGWQGESFREDDVPLFYADADAAVSASVEALSDDTLAVARALEQHDGAAFDLGGVLSIHDWLRMSYPTQTADLSSVSSCFRTGPIQGRRAPTVELPEGGLVPNFQYRYLSEDVPYGLLVTRAIAELVGVETPGIDRVVRWAEANMGAEYMLGNRVAGRDTHGLPLPQNYGIDSLDALIEWHVRDASGIDRRTSAAR